jgi:hypothetical protein
MKIYRKALLSVVAGAALTSTCSAFSFSRAGFLTTSSRSSTSPFLSRTFSVTTARTRPQLQMNVFSNLFGGGGVQQQLINYSALDFPGNELGQMALDGKVVVTSERYPQLQAATFAGGCFWGLELAFQRVPGVAYTAVGYTQGPEVTPTYGQVCSGSTKHTEAVLVYFDPKECSYNDVSFIFILKFSTKVLFL